MKIQKGKNGITLIALVVTIVVLLILAGISINMTLGNNGIITKAKETRNAMTNATTSDNEFLNSIDDFIDQNVHVQYGVRIEGDKLMFYGQDGKVYNLQTDYSTDELEVKDGYVYFKEPIQDSSGNTVEILDHGKYWECVQNGEGSEDFYQIRIDTKHTSSSYTYIYAKYDKEGKYLGEVSYSKPT